MSLGWLVPLIGRYSSGPAIATVSTASIRVAVLPEILDDVIDAGGKQADGLGLARSAFFEIDDPCADAALFFPSIAGERSAYVRFGDKIYIASVP